MQKPLSSYPLEHLLETYQIRVSPLEFTYPDRKVKTWEASAGFNMRKSAVGESAREAVEKLIESL